MQEVFAAWSFIGSRGPGAFARIFELTKDSSKEEMDADGEYSQTTDYGSRITDHEARRAVHRGVAMIKKALLLA
jgi:hypothetical protein